MENINLILYKNGSAYDISELAENIKWKGRKGSAARTLEVSLSDSGKARSGIDVTEGNHIVFCYDKKELFRGIIMSQQQSGNFKMPIKAYDNGIYLANNKDTFVYENKTVHDILLMYVKDSALNILMLQILHTKFQSLPSQRLPHGTQSWTQFLRILKLPEQSIMSNLKKAF